MYIFLYFLTQSISPEIVWTAPLKGVSSSFIDLKWYLNFGSTYYYLFYTI